MIIGDPVRAAGVVDVLIAGLENGKLPPTESPHKLNAPIDKFVAAL